MPKDTSIGIDNELWKRLNSRKGPGDSFEEVIADALDELEELQEANDVDADRERERVDHAEDLTQLEQFDADADVDELLQEASDDVGDDDKIIANIETPSYSTRDDFEAAAVAIIDHIRTRGETTRSAAQEALHEDFPAGYTNERTWWRRVVKPVLEAHPDVRAPAKKGASKWTVAERR